MDAKLKAALIGKIHIAQEELKSPRAVKALLEDRVRSTHLNGDVERPQNALYMRAQKKLLKERLWGPIRDALAEDGFAAFLRNLQRLERATEGKTEITAARQRQLALFPGFESLPVRIRKGPGFVRFSETSVAEFIDYERRYQVRLSRNGRTAEELHRLAGKVRPFAQTEPELALAEAFGRAQAQPAKLSAVAKIG